MLVVFSYDKLILYAVLMFMVGLIIRIVNQAYSSKTFRNVHFLWPKDRKMLKDMLTFAMWSLVGSAGVIMADQGQNILLNMYFGPAVNAARGVATQVKTAVVNLSNNFGQAVAPQINKSFAGGNVEYMHTLIFAMSKYTFFLLFIMTLPICLEAKTLLSIWLVDVPEHSVMFLQLMLVISILTALGQPLSNAAGANGKIRNFQILVGGTNLMLVPLTWVVFKLQDKPIPEWAFHAQIFICVVAQIARLILVKPLINLSLREYAKKVCVPCVVVTVASSIVPAIVKVLLPDNIMSFFVVVIVSVISVSVFVLTIGMRAHERQVILSKMPIIKKFYDKN